MKKAYDRIECELLWATLKAFDYPVNWIQWVKECVTKVSYSIKICGKSADWFRLPVALEKGVYYRPFCSLYAWKF